MVRVAGLFSPLGFELVKEDYLPKLYKSLTVYYVLEGSNIRGHYFNPNGSKLYNEIQGTKEI